MKVKVSIIILICLFIVTCTFNCDKEMAKVKAQRGEPEEVNRYDTSDYHSVDWWYWSKGICYTFKWGSTTDGCEVSTYTFTPIAKNYPKEIKNAIKEDKKWD